MVTRATILVRPAQYHSSSLGRRRLDGEAPSPNKSDLTEATKGGQGASAPRRVAGQVGEPFTLFSPQTPACVLGSRAVRAGLTAAHPTSASPRGGPQGEAWGGGRRACLHLMDGTEEMSGTWAPAGEVKLQPPLPPIRIPACPPRKGEGVGSQSWGGRALRESFCKGSCVCAGMGVEGTWTTPKSQMRQKRIRMSPLHSSSLAPGRPWTGDARCSIQPPLPPCSAPGVGQYSRPQSGVQRPCESPKPFGGWMRPERLSCSC